MRSGSSTATIVDRPDEHEEAGDDSGCAERADGGPTRVQGGGGLRLHVREWGKADGPPILFIHGWSQNHLCWAKQYESALADEFRLVAYDLRGHGMSEAPLEPEHYTDGELWADDVAAIIDQLRLDRPVLVGWSYGAFVICDYVRAYGQERIAAIDFVEGAVKLGEAAFGTLIGPGFLDHFADATADDLPTNIRGMRAFVRACVAKPLARRRPRDGAVLEHGRAGADPRQPRRARDRLTTTCCGRSRCRCSSRTAGRTRSCCRRWPSTSSRPARPPRPPGTTASVTLPHLEEPERFNRELADADPARQGLIAAGRGRQLRRSLRRWPRHGRSPGRRRCRPRPAARRSSRATASRGRRTPPA